MNFFLDSGAFSAWTKKTEINLDDYMQFIKDNKKMVTVYANLDVIGDPEGTWVNQKIMEDNGLSPMPIYHMGSSEKYLRKCMEYDYFALGAMAKASAPKRIAFLDYVFKTIAGKDGKPRNKTHGLGMTSFPLMMRYPFFSVDSTSWLMTGALGGIMVPRTKKGEWDYTKNPYKIAVSSSSPKIGKNQHFASLDKDMQSLVLRYIKEKGYKLGVLDAERGTEEAGLAVEHNQRMTLNAEYMLDFQKTVPKYPWAIKFTKSKQRIW